VELQAISEAVGGNVDQASQRVRALIDELERSRKEQARLSALLASRQVDEVAARAQDVNGVKVVAARVDGAGQDALRGMADGIRARLGSVVVVLATSDRDSVALIAALTEDLRARGLDAGQIVKEVAATVSGGGGGRPDFANGRGRDPSKLGEALQRVPAIVRERLARGA
jgi:alanyl-tRNA synthetase